MPMRSILLASAVFALLALMACPGAQKITDKMPKPAIPVISGKFASDACVAQPQADGTTSYTKTAYTFTPTTWAMDVDSFGDEACATPLGTLHADGPYTVSGPSTKVPGAFDADLVFQHRTITPHHEGYIALMQSMSCGKAPYAVDQAQDVLTTGCPEMGVPSLADCPREYDLVKVEGNALTFGKRPADNNICTVEKRPSELSAQSFTLVP